jgi:rsbT antagonist protein RsbS
MIELEEGARPYPRVPLIHLRGNLIVPIQDLLPDAALERLRDDVTHRIARGGARGVILDVSAVETMDSHFTRVVRDLALTARLMGARTVLSGVPPLVSMTMIEMGLDLPGVATALDLERALERLEEAAADDLDEVGDGVFHGAG